MKKPSVFDKEPEAKEAPVDTGLESLANQIQASYVNALDIHHSVMKFDTDRGTALGIAGLSIPPLKDLEHDLCANWPKILGLLNMGLGIVSVFQPVLAAEAKAALSAVDRVVIGPVCSIVPRDKPEPKAETSGEPVHDGAGPAKHEAPAVETKPTFTVGHAGEK